MAKKKDKRTKKNGLKQETLQGIAAIVSGALGIFLVLAALGKAGVAGTFSHDMLKKLLGVGFYMLPLISFVLCAALLRSLHRTFSAVQTISAFIFFFSGLGALYVSFGAQGGVVGRLIAWPFVEYFGNVASLVFLFAIGTASFLALFDTGIPTEWISKIPTLFTKKPAVRITGTKSAVDDDENDTEDAEHTDDEDEESDSDEEEDGDENEEESDEAEPEFTVTEGMNERGGKDSSKERRFPYLGRKAVPVPLSLLEKDKGTPGVGDIKGNVNIIKRSLQNFGIDVEMDEVTIGPTVTRYALKPAEGVKLSRIVGLQDNLSLALAAHPLRIEAPIPGKSLVGIEIPNSTKATVGLASMLGSDEFQSSEKPLLISIGKSIAGKAFFGNIAKMPHLLIAGATGSGKSVTIHAVITSLLCRNSPENLKLILIDPKRVELTLYNGIPHLLNPVITNPKKTIQALRWAAKEMDRRYDILETEKVRDIESYHKNVLTPAFEKASKEHGAETAKLPEAMPYIVIVIDELADIMSAYPRELEAAIVRLAQMSRAVGIHLILSTQRPSVNVITGLIKANIPARLALQVASQIDSRTILDMGGAEKLLGAGDMLYLSGDMPKPARLQSAYISENEVKKVVKFLKEAYSDILPDEILATDAGDETMIEGGGSDDFGEEDPLYEDARLEVIQSRKASTSYLQRRMSIGYSRAARLMDLLEKRGVIGPSNGAKPREVLVPAPDGGTSNEETPDGQ